MGKSAANSQTNDLKKLVQEGEGFFNEHNMDKAKVCFEQIIATAPRNYEALNNLGVIHFQEGHLQQAIDLFHRALSIRDDYEVSLQNLALCLVQTGKHAEAAKIFEKVLNTGDGRPETLISIIHCHTQSGEFSLAKYFLTRFIHAFGHQNNFLDVQNKIIDELRTALHSGKYPLEKVAKFYLDEGNLAAARDLLIPALKLKPREGVFHNLKDLLRRKEKLTRLPIAIISASDLLEKDPARKLRWGDHWFAKDLAEALCAEGAVISTERPRVLIHLHGIPINKVEEATYNIIWIHSHPDLITHQSLSPL